jgi:virulence-associated protein VapD
MKQKLDALVTRLRYVHQDLEELFPGLSKVVDKKAAKHILTDLLWAMENCTVIGLHQIGQALEDDMGYGSGAGQWPTMLGYAIAVDFDNESLRQNYGDPCNNAYLEIRSVLLRHGFQWQQGSVYFGDVEVNAVTCVLAAMDLARSLPWFAASVRDIRMLRIEELNDLMPAVQQGRQ